MNGRQALFSDGPAIHLPQLFHVASYNKPNIINYSYGAVWKAFYSKYYSEQCKQ